MSDLISKLVEVQSALKAPKSNYNSFGKYKYRSAEDILEAVKPLLKEHGLMLTITDEIEHFDTDPADNRYYVKATAIIRDGKDALSVCAYAREDKTKKGMDGSQITGGASSYARKYALNGLFLIDDTKDADAQTPQKQEKKSQSASKTPEAPKAADTQTQSQTAAEPVSEAQKKTDHLEPIRALIKDYAVKLGINTAQAMQNILDYMGCDDMKQIAPDAVETVLRFMADQMNAVS